VFDSYSAASRLRKLELFFERLQPSPTDRVLDVGGECDPKGGSVQLSDHYQWRDRLTLVNIDSDALKRVNTVYPECHTLLGDACRLPFPDRHFDIGFSNAVIEHLFTWDNQRLMAAEMQRVCKRWFLATPNRWYPYEFHARLPVISWLPAPVMRKVTRQICYNHVHKRYMRGLQTDSIRLMTARELRKLFPTSTILPLRITFYPETLLAIGSHNGAA
jgi:ubiquinone/menaquinone biosynthesis C-methylase UbiE